MLEKTGLEPVLRKIAQKRREILAGGGLLLAFGLGLAITELVSQYCHYAAEIETRLNNHGLDWAPGIYAAPRRVSVGQQVTEDELKERLLRAGYQETTQADNFSVGSFTSQDGVIAIRTNEFAQSEALPALVRISFGSQKQARRSINNIQDTAAASRSYILLPAEMITANIESKRQTRRSAAYSELPAVLVKAVTAIEDRNFFEHSGIDLRGITRAAWKNMRAGEICEGGSTITQQLIKNHLLTSDRNWERKSIEMMMAVELERRLSKEQILELYAERVFLGRGGITEIYGFKQAARMWFGKELSELSLSEAALLAGVIRAPNHYSPYTQFEAALARRNVVLNAMVEAGHISDTEAAAAKGEQLAICPAPPPDASAAPYFVDYLGRELRKYQSDENEVHPRIQTTLDLDLQQAAVEAVREQTARLDKIFAKQGVKPEAALVALDPRTGEILAMVGGRDYNASQLNRVSDAMRQPGSVFKPFVYAAALTRGISPVTTFLDAPQEFQFGYKAVYKPSNYGRTFSNQQVMLREGIIRSLNVVTVEAARQVGLGVVADLADRAGLPKPQAYPSLALGTFEATPLDVARAYTIFANQGMRVEPTAIKAITTKGTTNEISPVKSGVISAPLAYVVTDALKEVVERGTAAQIRRAGYKGAAAGKTGTSRDAWFVGYTPNLLVVVWVGFDDNRDLRMTGGQVAVPLWTSFITRALALRPELAKGKFSEPAGLETFEVDPQTGMLANQYCPRRQQLRLPGYMIPPECFEHQAPVEQVAVWPELSADTTDEETTDQPQLQPLLYRDWKPKENPASQFPTSFPVIIPEPVKKPAPPGEREEPNRQNHR
jgi:penicillin-binding protein 1B